jgi:hypothetical protein
MYFKEDRMKQKQEFVLGCKSKKKHIIQTGKRRMKENVNNTKTFVLLSNF